ncbi:MAG: hypothetical protein J0L77_08485 [Alphaproteobacteria bacterium]|nr:hypothetical protein [Alphaproteobacteria bacterium]
MRFKKIEPFKVDELLLDEDNYRFKAAPNQKACIEKIFLASQQNFKNLITSVAEDDLGELLLVYQHKGKNIVLDGNRRLAALKVLSNPQKYSPTEAIRDHAEKLLLQHKVDFSDIQAQVSSDKQLIFKTVYERHAAGQGKSRIGWSAYGAARFRYDQQVEEGNDWYSLALLLETENKYPIWTDFIDSTDYSHEVFRRIFKSALDKGVISRSLFSDRNQRIKTSADKKLLKDAIDKVNRFLTAMKDKDLSLSRSGKYADKESVDEYISQFALSPDNARAQPPAGTPTGTRSGTGTSAVNSGGVGTTTAVTTGTSTSVATSPPKDKKSYGIEQSDGLTKKLSELKSQKLIGLYKSLCTVSLYQHPQLLYAGAWSFFESLSALMGKKEGTSFDSFLGSYMNNMGYTKIQKKDFAKPLKDISETGNLNKHSGTYHSKSAYQLRGDFTTLEPFILSLLDSLIAKNKKAA